VSQPKRLLLIGGGHAHLFVLEALRRRRTEWHGRLDVTLVSRDLHTPYSGMLPGLIAGHYRPRECHVDLQPLASAAGIELTQASVRQINFAARIAHADTGAWPFDLVSLDIGAAPALAAVPGAAEHACAIKPIPLFLEQWQQFQALLQRARQSGEPVPAQHLVVVGGGAGGVEAALAIAARLAPWRTQVKCSLVTAGALLPGYPRRTARLLARHLAKAGVALRQQARVVAVEDGRLLFADGSAAAFDRLLWATGAAPQAWLAASGLACDANGFIVINRQLQSASHPDVFAAGDIASCAQDPRPKAGVFAVRQGPFLAENLLRHALQPLRPLLSYRPQHDYLSLVSTGARHAVASWHGLAWQGDWVWRWKDRIDRRFMQRFSAPFEADVPA